MKTKVMSLESKSNWWAAFIPAASVGMYKYYSYMDVDFDILNWAHQILSVSSMDWVRIHLLSINWTELLSQFVKAIPVIAASGFGGVLLKKFAEDVYSFGKKLIIKNIVPWVIHKTSNVFWPWLKSKFKSTKNGKIRK